MGIARSEKLGKHLPKMMRYRSLVDSLGTSKFGNSFFSFLNAFIDVDDCTVFVIPRDDNPTCLVAEGKNNRAITARTAAEQYVSRYHSRDTNITSLLDDLHGSAIALRYVHKDSIPDHDYRMKFYDGIDIQEKVSVLTRFDKGYLYSNFYRSPKHEHFDDDHIMVIREISRIAVSCLKKHLSFMPSHSTAMTRESRLDQVYRLLTTRESVQLTPREADICARIILGYSTTAIALDLDITENTVSTLRKRAYDRLDICSQNELFALCLEGLN